MGALQALPRLLGLGAAIAAALYVHTLRVDAARADGIAQRDAKTISALTEDRDGLADALRKTAALSDQLAAIQTDNLKGHADAKRSTETLLADLRAGRVRLSVPTVQAAGSAQRHESGGAGGAAPGPGQARAELDPEAGASLVAIASDGDAAILDLNACIDAYAAVRRRVNGPGDASDTSGSGAPGAAP